MEKEGTDGDSRKPSIDVEVSFEVGQSTKEGNNLLAKIGAWVFWISVCGLLFCAYHYLIEAALVFFFLIVACAIVWAWRNGKYIRITPWL